MTSPTARIQAALRYVAIVPLIAVGLLSILATHDDDDASALPGHWDAFRLLATGEASLWQVETSSGTSLRISGSGLGSFLFVEGLAFDPNTNTLYGTDRVSDQLLTIDPSTGVATVIGALGFDRVDGLAFDPNTNTLYGTDTGPGGNQLLTIDPTTGVGTAVGGTDPRLQGLAFR